MLASFRWLGVATLGLLSLTVGFANGQQPVAVSPTPDPVLIDSAPQALPGTTLPESAAPPATDPVPAPPVNPYSGDLMTRSRLTGDWWGARSALAECGLTFDFFATQFYQGIASGGNERSWEYGGKLDYLFNVDGEKLGLWKGLFVNMHAETRYGQDVNPIDGLIAPSNIAMNFPNPSNVTALTGVKFTQALSENFAVYAGKINTLDEYPLRYSPGLGNNRPGLEGFQNTSLVFNPIAARTIPYAAAGVGFAVVKDHEPVFTFTVFDPEERSTIGLQNLYERGVVLVPDLVLRTKFFDRPGTYNFGATYSSAQYRSFDPAAYLNIPFLRSVLAQNATTPLETGSWSAYANFYQSLWMDPNDGKRTWGVFGQFGISDGNPNPVRFVANGGIGGRSMIPGRKLDTFGIGYFYLGLSDNFKALSGPLSRQQDEYGT